MTPSLTGRRSRSELIAELYERHAAGLFAYCHDQLGETASAGDAVVAVFTAVPTVEPPPRAVLYALGRREIYRRDVSYALPAVDSVADPATALIERVFRDIRPHQREVLLLSAVCGLVTPELAVVLDVALDTADELTGGARRRFAQTLETAVTAARSAPFLAAGVAEVYDAIGVAPIEDVLARLPWRRPAAAVRDRVLSALPYEDPVPSAPSSALPTKRLWPTPPTWPLPLSDPNPASSTIVVKAGTIGAPEAPADGTAATAPTGTPAEPRRRARHEATTEPMPKLRGSLLAALGEGRTRRRRPSGPALPAPVADTPVADAAVADTPETAVPAADPGPAGALDAFRAPGLTASSSGTAADMAADTAVFDAFALASFAASAVTPKAADTPASTAASDAASTPFDAFRPAEPEARRPAEPPVPVSPAAPASAPVAPASAPAPVDLTRPEPPAEPAAPPAAAPAVREPGRRAVQATGPAGAARRAKQAPARGRAGGRAGDKHYDWLWELVGFLICLAIALIVFFAVPTIVSH
ncbi:hypothetical protein [Microbispora corallina]|uniref:hypothetical protein n=1 Tax=Microbispora corallina TaxID=83302 RepID=UPI00194E01A7|nr:hypothetical protein [Microbispora corallina]